MSAAVPAPDLGVVFCSHRTADVSLRERLGFSADALGDVYAKLRDRFPASELVVLSTCNRIEVYSAVPPPSAGAAAPIAPRLSDLAGFLSEFHAIPQKAFAPHLLERRGPEAVRHLFEVSASLDSLVLGESQIVGQVRDAYDLAQRHEACGPLTHALFQAAFRTAGRVRRETKLSDGRTSIASVAVGQFGRNIFERFTDKTVLVIGSGEMADETLRYLHDEGTGRVVIVNRSPERAAALAEARGGEVRPWEELDSWLGEADVIVSATGATTPLVTRERFAAARRGHSGRPVFILDLGLPRDFDPAVARVDSNVFRYDLDDLETTCAANRRRREKEIGKARGIVEEETEAFLRGLVHRATGPVIRRLRDEWTAVRDAELAQLYARRSEWSDDDRAAVERSVDRIVNKLLHPPLEALKEEARRGEHGTLFDSFRRLFGI
ncbi:glutamyl-tRNA reductase [Alienimonas chondri]|uniref:Glutamyl-tRNA reductase n=1 Tax=Alienimonas chondri TaxID=2681879 RepID=A0ABX1VDY3_9PLAN|nr:glutamyl-tRNA reductase [Alienimonas chondri]NNJ25998.1 Glutamyl-tRNA reductase [Alienimonas chondri]